MKKPRHYRHNLVMPRPAREQTPTRPRPTILYAVGLGIIGMAALLRGISYLPNAVNQGRKAAHFLEELAAPAMW